MDWATHFRAESKISQVSPRTTLGVDFGSDASDAVVAYRSLWNSYVMTTISAMDTASQALANLAANPPDGFTSDELSQLGTSYASERDDYLQAWNQFSGDSTDTMTAEASVMISAFQGVVSKAQAFWKAEKMDALNPAGDEPAQPSASAQAKVNAQIKAISNKSPFALAFQSLTGIEMPTLPSVGSTALQFAKDHWVAIGLTVVGVGVGLKAVSLVGRGYLKVATGGLL